MLVFFALLLGALTYLLLPKPDLGLGGSFYKGYSKALYSDNGQLLRLTLAQDQRYRLYTRLADISPDFVDATILYEDQDFYAHSGVDYLALVRAFWQTYVKAERRIGASTITMQVARLRWNIPSNTPSGKVEQIIRALQISRHYSKEEVLEAYLNLAPYGGNIEGIGAASLIYYGKAASDLNLAEAITLALVPQNPNKRNPAANASNQLSSGKGNQKEPNTSLAIAKQNLTERLFESRGDKMGEGDKSMLRMPLSVSTVKDLPFLAPHFTNYVIQQQHQSSGSAIRTTLDLRLQKALQARITRYIDSKRALGFKNASAMLIDTRSMHIKAMIGSADFANADIQGQVNGTQALRSPGSTLKPFVYALAMDAGLIHPQTMLKDLPTRYAAFTPENFDKGFVGPISATDALVRSRNVPAVTLQAELNKANLKSPDLITLYELLEEVEVNQLKSEDYYGLALTLGGGEITMQKLLEMYSAIANAGVYSSAVSTYWVSGQEKAEKALFSPEAAFLTRRMLSKNQQPFSVRNNSEKQAIAWKTGTSWAYRDAWAIGLVGDYALAVWIGNFSGEGNNAFVGRTAAGPLFFDIASYLQSVQTVSSDLASASLNIKKVGLCKSTGDLYEEGCPEKTQGYFIPGVSPIKQSNIYRALYIDKDTGQQRCDRDLSKAEKRYFAFWPSDVLNLYAKAGIYFDRPPSKHDDCASSNGSTAIDMVRQSEANAISIFSPRNDATYLHTANSDVNIALQANSSAQSKRLFWFANTTFIGEREITGINDTTLFWQAPPGDYEIVVSDEEGNTASVNIKVLSRPR
jgi:penicillin-binding protein 1C